MPTPWLLIADACYAAISFMAKAFGGDVGLAIVTVSIAVRVALLPIAVRAARHAQAQAAILEALRPELERLKRKHAKDRDRLAHETFALYRRHGYQPIGGVGIASVLVQLPIVGGLLSAIGRGLGRGARFLWISDLAKPDAMLALLAAALAFLAASMSTGPRNPKALFSLLSAVITLWFMWKVSAAVGLYWAGSTLVGLGQSVLLRPARKR